MPPKKVIGADELKQAQQHVRRLLEQRDNGGIVLHRLKFGLAHPLVAEEEVLLLRVAGPCLVILVRAGHRRQQLRIAQPRILICYRIRSAKQLRR